MSKIQSPRRGLGLPCCEGEGLTFEFCSHLCKEVSKTSLRRHYSVSFSLCGLQVINDRQLGCREGGTTYHMFPILVLEF